MPENDILKTIRPACNKDLAAVALIHKSQFGDHFLGQYSPDLLARFYCEFLNRSIFLVHDSADGIDGFVMGGEDRTLSKLNVEFVRNNLLRCIGETLIRPKVWISAAYRGVMIVLMHPGKVSLLDLSANDNDISLLSIAVAKESLGKGVAIALVKAFEAALSDRVSFYRLSVKNSNARAVAFYHKLGFEIESDSGGSIRFRRNVKGSEIERI